MRTFFEKNLSFQKFIGACLGSNAEDGMVAKFSQKFTVQNSKASPGETHSGAKKTARTPENIEAVWVGGCERRIVRQSQPLAQRRRGGDTTSWAAIKYHDTKRRKHLLVK